MANGRELSEFHNATFEEMVDLIVELREIKQQQEDEILELKSENDILRERLESDD